MQDIESQLLLLSDVSLADDGAYYFKLFSEKV